MEKVSEWCSWSLPARPTAASAHCHKQADRQRTPWGGGGGDRGLLPMDWLKIAANAEAGPFLEHRAVTLVPVAVDYLQIILIWG